MGRLLKRTLKKVSKDANNSDKSPFLATDHGLLLKLYLTLQVQVWKVFQRKEPLEVYTEYSCFQRFERR